MLSSPDAVRDYLRLLLTDRPPRGLCVVFLDDQHGVLAMVEMFRGNLTQTPYIHARSLLRPSPTVLAHNHPSGHTEPSAADLAITQTLRQALALVDVRVLDHFVITRHGLVSSAERELTGFSLAEGPREQSVVNGICVASSGRYSFSTVAIRVPSPSEGEVLRQHPDHRA